MLVLPKTLYIYIKLLVLLISYSKIRVFSKSYFNISFSAMNICVVGNHLNCINTYSSCVIVDA